MTNIINLLWTMSTTLPFCPTSVPERAEAAAHMLSQCRFQRGRQGIRSLSVSLSLSLSFSLVTHNVFWDVTACSLVHGYQSFRLTFFLHIQGQASSLEMQTHSFVWNVGTYLHVYRCYIREDGYLRCHCHDKLKCYLGCNFLFPYFHWFFLLSVT
jgi:hypothetical protein